MSVSSSPGFLLPTPTIGLPTLGLTSRSTSEAGSSAVTWRDIARPEQLPPSGDWRVWYLHGGRGSGKTRAGAEAMAEWILGEPPGEWAIIAPTYGDARDTCMEGPSGLLKALGNDHIDKWNRSIGELYVTNGALVRIDGADDGALRIQGKNLRGAWCDEVGLWKPNQWKRAWEESIAFAVRMGHARIIATGTPKSGHPLVKRLMDDPDVPKSAMRTEDNAANLSPAALEELRKRYEGTRLGRQELGGEYIDEVEGALWSYAMIEALRWTPQQFKRRKPDLARVVVAIDPAVTSGEDADETGIIVAGVADCGCKGNGQVERHGFLLADRSCRMSPDGWARRGIAAYDQYEGSRIIGEVNNGGDMVEHTIRTVRRNVPFTAVHASRGKRVRAEPVAALYEQGKVHHVGTFPELEDQMTGFLPDGGLEHDDRVDALVWALTDLMLTGGSPNIRWL
ncbi:MAG TPA: terminase family protein [Trueperaceae bacterium]